MSLISFHDFLDAYLFIKRKSLSLFFKRFAILRQDSVNATWGNLPAQVINFGGIVTIQREQDKKISGNPDLEGIQYFLSTFLKSNEPVRILSIGCGNGHNELEIASHIKCEKMLGVDFSKNAIRKAVAAARDSGHPEVEFVEGDIEKMQFPPDYFDCIIALNSLHHFSKLSLLIPKLKLSLKKAGYFTILEYVGPNRVQWTKAQLDEANILLKKIPEDLRVFQNTRMIKTRVEKPGLLRMLISDRTEAVESSNIIPELRNNFVEIQLTHLGGTILMPLFQNIAHHFIHSGDERTDTIVKMCIEHEDDLINSGKLHSDFVFGVYQKI